MVIQSRPIWDQISSVGSNPIYGTAIYIYIWDFLYEISHMGYTYGTPIFAFLKIYYTKRLGTFIIHWVCRNKTSTKSAYQNKTRSLQQSHIVTESYVLGTTYASFLNRNDILAKNKINPVVPNTGTTHTSFLNRNDLTGKYQKIIFYCRSYFRNDNKNLVLVRNDIVVVPKQEQ